MTDLQLNEYVYKSRKHIIEMIKERGYDTNNISVYSKDGLIELLGNHRKGGFDLSSDLSALDIHVSKKLEDGISQKLIIKYRLDEKFKKSKKLQTQIDEIFDKYELTRNDCLIIMNVDIVYMKEGIKNNNVMLKFINQQYTEGKYVQIYGLQNFLFNVYNHTFVPKHTIVPKDEVKDVVELYRTKIEKLPKIFREDAIAKFIGAKPGDLIKIKGFSETSGFITKYRLCIDNVY